MSDPATSPVERVARAHAALRARLRGGPAWQARRQAALERLLRVGLPDRRDENWKYLDWPEVMARELAPSAESPAASPPPEADLALPGACRLVTVDGRLSAGLSDRALPAGVAVEELGAALERDPALAERLRVPGDDADDRFALLAEAFTDAGVLIRVAAGAEVAVPIHVLHVGEAGASHARVAIEAGSGSRLQLVEQFLGGAAGGLANLSVEIAVGAGARLEHVRLHEQQASAVHVETLSVAQERDSRYRLQSFVLGGRVVRSGLRLRLAGAGAETEVEGLFMVDGVRQADLYTVIEHLAPRTRTVENFRGVASNRGRGAFNGRIVVHEGAAKADSRQTSRNLILTPLAEINARPQLEILTDDVQCSHGSTVGSLDPQQFFYLLSRGLDPATARGLLTFAFCEDVVARAPWPELRRHVEELVVGRLPDRDVIREFV